MSSLKPMYKVRLKLFLLPFKKIEVEGVKVTIVHSAVGAINESDVTLAEASNAFIIGFNVRPTPQSTSTS